VPDVNVSEGDPGFTEALSHVVPFLRVGDVERSLEFYVDQLGFRENWRHQADADLPRVVSITRGGVTIVLSEHTEVSFGGLVYLYTTELDIVFHELVARGITLDLAPTDMPWGMREMHLRDPDGNMLRIGQPSLV